MKVEKIMELEGWNAGEDGHKVICVVDDTGVCETVVNKKGKTVKVPLIIATMRVKDKGFIKKLEEMCDDQTPVEEILVVGKKFQHMTHKSQLALATLENLRFSYEDDEVLDAALVRAEIDARAEFGNLRVDWVMWRERFATRKARHKLGRVGKKCRKASAKQDKVQQAVDQVLNEGQQETAADKEPNPQPQGA